MRCINIDWLQLYGHLARPKDIVSMLTDAGFYVLDNKRGTRHFASWYTVFDHTRQFAFAQICCDPFSVKTTDAQGIFLPGSATVQLCNRFCYAPDPIDLIGSLCSIIEFKFRSISRLDLCCDLQQFDNMMRPTTLIRGFYTNEYWKVGLTKALGVGSQGAKYEPQTISFAGKNSAISVKMYNKSLEMRDKVTKPYILDAWRECGILNERDVWRLEISIKSDGRTILNTDTGEYIQFGIKDIATHEQRADMFLLMAKKKWHWKYNDGKTRKTRCKDVKLFNIDQEIACWKPTKITFSKDYGKKAKMLTKALYEMLDNPTWDKNEIRDMKLVAFYLMKEYRLLPNGV